MSSANTFIRSIVAEVKNFNAADISVIEYKLDLDDNLDLTLEIFGGDKYGKAKLTSASTPEMFQDIYNYYLLAVAAANAQEQHQVDVQTFVDSIPVETLKLIRTWEITFFDKLEARCNVLGL